MAEADVTYSPETARRAAQFFCWHRFLTTVGLLYLGSFVPMVGMMVFTYIYAGNDWFLGFLGTIVGMNLILQVTTTFSLPHFAEKAVTSRTSNHAHLVTDDEGLTLSLDGNVVKLPWARIRYVWPRSDFIVLGLSFMNMLHIPTQGMSTVARAEFEKRESKTIGA